MLFTSTDQMECGSSKDSPVVDQPLDGRLDRTKLKAHSPCSSIHGEGADEIEEGHSELDSKQTLPEAEQDNKQLPPEAVDAPTPPDPATPNQVQSRQLSRLIGTRSTSQKEPRGGEGNHSLMDSVHRRLTHFPRAASLGGGENNSEPHPSPEESLCPPFPSHQRSISCSILSHSPSPSPSPSHHHSRPFNPAAGAGRIPFSTPPRSGRPFKGVRKRRWGRFICEIRDARGRRIWLGSHDTQEGAARVYDAAARVLQGGTAWLNFPEDDVSHHVTLPEETLQTLLLHRAGGGNGDVKQEASPEGSQGSPDSLSDPSSSLTATTMLPLSPLTTLTTLTDDVSPIPTPSRSQVKEIWVPDLTQAPSGAPVVCQASIPSAPRCTASSKPKKSQSGYKRSFSESAAGKGSSVVSQWYTFGGQTQGANEGRGVNETMKHQKVDAMVGSGEEDASKVVSIDGGPQSQQGTVGESQRVEDGTSAVVCQHQTPSSIAVVPLGTAYSDSNGKTGRRNSFPKLSWVKNKARGLVGPCCDGGISTTEEQLDQTNRVVHVSMMKAHDHQQSTSELSMSMRKLIEMAKPRMEARGVEPSPWNAIGVSCSIPLGIDAHDSIIPLESGHAHMPCWGWSSSCLWDHGELGSVHIVEDHFI